MFASRAVETQTPKQWQASAIQAHMELRPEGQHRKWDCSDVTVGLRVLEDRLLRRILGDRRLENCWYRGRNIVASFGHVKVFFLYPLCPDRL
jgi:hypothetical protein